MIIFTVPFFFFKLIQEKSSGAGQGAGRNLARPGGDRDRERSARFAFGGARETPGQRKAACDGREQHPRQRSGGSKNSFPSVELRMSHRILHICATFRAIELLLPQFSECPCVSTSFMVVKYENICAGFVRVLLCFLMFS